MIQRGRKGAATTTAAATVVKGGFGLRPEPPDNLMPEAAAIWRMVVGSEPVELFATAATRYMLTDYCRHMATANKVSEIIDLFQADWLKSKDGVKRYSDLCKVRDAEGRAAADKATKLRLTNQSRLRAETAARMGDRTLAGPKPWDSM